MEDVKRPESGGQVEREVPQERPLHQFERPCETHRAGDDRRDEEPRPEELAKHELWAGLGDPGQRGEDVRRPVAERQDRHPRHVVRKSAIMKAKQKPLFITRPSISQFKEPKCPWAWGKLDAVK